MKFQNGSAFQNGSSEWKCIPEWKFRVKVNSRVEYLLNGPYGLPYFVLELWLIWLTVKAVAVSSESCVVSSVCTNFLFNLWLSLAPKRLPFVSYKSQQTILHLHCQKAAIRELQQVEPYTQHGFRHKHSCQSQLLETVHKWTSTLDSGNSTHAIFLDFSKAFDTVFTQKTMQETQTHAWEYVAKCCCGSKISLPTDFNV